MMNEQTDEMRLYFTRIKPVCRELFSAAYAICGDYEQAEYALRRVILSGWQGRGRFRGTRAFRENLRNSMRRTALSRLDEVRESTWDQLAEDPLSAEEADPLLRHLQAQDVTVRRAVLLKYGCMLKNRQIARCLDITARQADQMTNRFLRQAKLRADAGGRPEARLREICREHLVSGETEMPDLGAIYRNFQAAADQGARPVRRAASRTVTAVAAILLVILLAGLFWVTASVIRPAQIQDDAPLTRTAQEENR